MIILPNLWNTYSKSNLNNLTLNLKFLLFERELQVIVKSKFWFQSLEDLCQIYLAILVPLLHFVEGCSVLKSKTTSLYFVFLLGVRYQHLYKKHVYWTVIDEHFPRFYFISLWKVHGGQIHGGHVHAEYYALLCLWRIVTGIYATVMSSVLVYMYVHCMWWLHKHG